MASVLPFSTATIGGTALTAADFVYGSGTITITGTDEMVVTADNAIRHIRKKVVRSAKCELWGDKTALNSAAGLSAQQIIGGATFTGLATVTYNHTKRTSTVDIQGDPQDA